MKEIYNELREKIAKTISTWAQEEIEDCYDIAEYLIDNAISSDDGYSLAKDLEYRFDLTPDTELVEELDSLSIAYSKRKLDRKEFAKTFSDYPELNKVVVTNRGTGTVTKIDKEFAEVYVKPLETTDKNTLNWIISAETIK